MLIPRLTVRLRWLVAAGVCCLQHAVPPPIANSTSDYRLHVFSAGPDVWISGFSLFQQQVGLIEGSS